MDRDRIRLMNLRKQLWHKVREDAPQTVLLALILEMNNMTDKIMGGRDDGARAAPTPRWE